MYPSVNLAFIPQEKIPNGLLCVQASPLHLETENSQLQRSTPAATSASEGSCKSPARIFEPRYAARLKRKAATSAALFSRARPTGALQLFLAELAPAC